MQADERRLGDPDQRIIDLEVEERPHAVLAHLIQAAWRAARAASRQGGEGASVAVGREGDPVFRGQQDFAGGLVDGRHLPLGEEPDVFQAEAVVLLEEVDRRFVVLGAGHDVQRQGPSEAAAQRDDLLGVDLEQARRGDRPDGKGPLGPFESQASARTAGDEDDADLAGGEGVGPDPAGPAPGHALAVGLRQADDVDRPNPLGRRGRCRVSEHQLGDQPVEPVEIDRGDLGRQPRSRDLRSARPTSAGGAPVHDVQAARARPGRETSRAVTPAGTKRGLGERRPGGSAIPIQNSTLKPIVGQRDTWAGGWPGSAHDQSCAKDASRTSAAASSVSIDRECLAQRKVGRMRLEPQARPGSARPAPPARSGSHPGFDSHQCSTPASRPGSPGPANGPCSSRIGRTRLAQDLERHARLDRHELELGHEPRRPLLRARPKRVAENPPDDSSVCVLAIDRHRPADPAGKQPRIVEPEQMVGMVMRERDRMDLPHPLAQELDPHLGRGVDQQVAARESEQSTLGRVR